MKKNQNGFSAVEAVIILIILGIIGFIGWYIWQKKPSSNSSRSVVTITNTWTGKGTDLKWSDAANWSNGTPTSGENLVFNLADIPLKSDGRSQQLINDLTNITLNRITFQGKQAAHLGGFIITGNVLKLSNGIYDNLEERETGVPLQVYISTDVVFTGNGTLSIAEKAGYLVVGQASNSLSFGSHSLVLLSKGGGRLSVLGHLIGTGSLRIYSSTGVGLVSLDNDGSNLRSPINVQSGFVFANSQSLGSGGITVAKGATLALTSRNLSSTLANTLVLNGDGSKTSVSKPEGALLICFGPSGDNGCTQSPQQLTLTGQVTLNGDTQLGVNIATVIITKPVKGNYSLTTIPGSQGKITRP